MIYIHTLSIIEFAISSDYEEVYNHSICEELFKKIIYKYEILYGVERTLRIIRTKEKNMEEKGLVKKELNFLQRMRKSLYLRGMNPGKANRYYSLPDYLKQDEDVINIVVGEDEELINSIPVGYAKKILKQAPQLLSRFYDIIVLNQVFNENPELITYYESGGDVNGIYNLIYNEKLEGKKEFIKYLSKELQMKLLTDDIEYMDVVPGGINFGSRDSKRYGSFYKLKKYLDQFSGDVIVTLAMEEDLRVREGKIRRNKVANFDIQNLSAETQLKLLLISHDFDSEVSDDVMLRFVNGNPLLFDRMPNKLKRQIFPELLPKGFNIRNFEKPEKAIERIVFLGGTSYIEKEKVTDIRNDDYIWEMGQFDPSLVTLIPDTMQNIRNSIRNEYLVRNFYNHTVRTTGQNELTEYLERLSSMDGIRSYDYLYRQQGIETINRVVKMLLNDDIMRAVPGSTILDYAQNPSQKKLVEIIRIAYGDTSAKILEDRPQISIDLIPNLYIFKPEIVNEFGIGAVHANLSYNMEPTSGILSEIARKPELMQQFKMFNETMQGNFPDTAVGLKDKLTSFIKCRELMKNVDFRSLTEEQKETLQIALMDSNKRTESELVEFPKNLEDLENYNQKRNALYYEAITKETDIKKLKQLISRRFFGLDYNLDPHNIELSNPSVWGMVHFYNLCKFVNNPITLQGEKFSEEELDALELLDIFAQINEPEILVELAQELSKNGNVVNPITYRTLQEKVPMQYNYEMVNALLTPEKAMKMVEDGVPGIEMKEIDGVKVIFLNGVDFKLYVSNPFMNNSGVGTITSESLAKEWKEKEDGISTFSGCVIDQGEATSCIKKGEYGLGFSNISPYQIVGMGITDIHISHNKRQLSPYTTEGVDVLYDYPEEFMKKYARRLHIKDPYSDMWHPYDEMAMLRAEKCLSKIKEGTFGGKILADYIFMNGTKVDCAVGQAKECGINFVFAYDEEKYRDVDRSRMIREEKENPSREETEFMEKIKTITRGDNRDER